MVKIREYVKSIFNKNETLKEKFITIDSIKKTENTIDVFFTNSEDISEFLNDNHQILEYSDLNYDLSQIPDGIAVIPLVSNLLPLVWFFDLKLTLDEIDKSFYECIPEIKKGYQIMFPFIDFKGEVHCKKIKEYSYEPQDNSVALFSQGLDSINTVINNLDENLSLLTLQGSDIPVNRVSAWKNLKSKIDDFASSIGVDNYFVKSNFKILLNGKALNEELPNEMKKSWWHQFQHGIAIISHATIPAYLKKSKHIFIASSLSMASAKHSHVEFNPCASSPIIDNNFKFASCSVIHDGYEFERIDKLKNVINYSKQNGPVYLRVCFTSKKGDNCSFCNKCSRSILGLISENENPNEYGFEVNEETLLEIKKNLDELKNGVDKRGWWKIDFRQFFWIKLQENFQKNKDKYDFDESVNWILTYDFSDMDYS